MSKRILAVALIMVMGVALLSGCVEEQTKGERAKMLDTQKTETLKYSNERKIFQGYLDQVNNPNNIQFIYLMSWDGHVIYRSTVMGKTISATKSTEPYDRIIVETGTANSEDNGAKALAGYIAGTPNLMNPSGMFGHDTEGVIWQDPEGNYYEWHSGPYFVSSKPLKIEIPVLKNTDVDTELDRKVEEMRQKLRAGGNLTSEEKAYLTNN
jgi:hypothetical protein